MTEFVLYHRRHRFALRAINKALTVRIRKCPICGEKLTSVPDSILLVPKG